MEMRSQSIYNRRSRSRRTAVGEYRLRSHSFSHIDTCTIRFIGNSMGSRQMVLLALAIASAFPFLSTTGATESVFDANSWDMVVAHGDGIYFFKNDTEIRKSIVANISEMINALAYDSVNRTLYITDGVYIRSDVVEENLDSELTFDRILHTNEDFIRSMVFDPVTKTLFWIQGEALMKMEVASLGIDSAPQISKLYDSTASSDLSLDICHRFIYWTTNGNLGGGIERSRLDGTDRKVILTSDSPFSFYGSTVDHYGGKLYFGTTGGNWFQIEESNLDGTDRRVLVNSSDDVVAEPNRLAVDDTAVYWTGSTDKAMMWKMYKNGTAMRAIKEFPLVTNYFISSNVLTRHSVEGVDCKAVLDKEEIDTPDARLTHAAAISRTDALKPNLSDKVQHPEN